MQQTIIQAAALIVPLVIAIVFHEVAHGMVARLLGDPTAYEQRRLSMNPLRHVDPVGTVVLPGMLALAGAPVFGWAKPVPVNQQRLNNPRFGMMAVALAGPLSNLILAGVGAVLLGLMVRTAAAAAGDILPFVALNLRNFVLINIFLALFNLLPIPPLTARTSSKAYCREALPGATLSCAPTAFRYSSCCCWSCRTSGPTSIWSSESSCRRSTGRRTVTTRWLAWSPVPDTIRAVDAHIRLRRQRRI